MNVERLIKEYIGGQPEAKRNDMQSLHNMILNMQPDCRLWYLDGRNSEGKIVSNPNIGYGQYTIRYANGDTREFYRVGISANTSGISVYIMGIDDKTYLARTYGHTLGKASISGYCIKFKSLKDIDTDILKTVVRDRFTH